MDILSIASAIEQILVDVATVIKALPPPQDPAAKAALDRVTGTISTLAPKKTPSPPTGELSTNA